MIGSSYGNYKRENLSLAWVKVRRSFASDYQHSDLRNIGTNEERQLNMSVRLSPIYISLQSSIRRSSRREKIKFNQ